MTDEDALRLKRFLTKPLELTYDDLRAAYPEYVAERERFARMVAESMHRSWWQRLKLWWSRR